jgi:hypothetical protein
MAGSRMSWDNTPEKRSATFRICSIDFGQAIRTGQDRRGMFVRVELLICRGVFTRKSALR